MRSLVGCSTGRKSQKLSNELLLSFHCMHWGRNGSHSSVLPGDPRDRVSGLSYGASWALMINLKWTSKSAVATITLGIKMPMQNEFSWRSSPASIHSKNFFYFRKLMLNLHTKQHKIDLPLKPFQVKSQVVLSPFTAWGSTEPQNLAELKLNFIKQPLPRAPSCPLEAPILIFVSVHLTTLGALYVESYSICLFMTGLLQLSVCPQGSDMASLSQKPSLLRLNTIRCVFAPRFVCSVACWWTLGCSHLCCCE